MSAVSSETCAQQDPHKHSSLFLSLVAVALANSSYFLQKQWVHMPLTSLKPSVAFIVLGKFPDLLTVFLHVICTPYSFSGHIPSSPALRTCVSFSRNIVHPIPPWQTPTHHSDLSFGFAFPNKTSLTINSKHGASRKSYIIYHSPCQIYDDILASCMFLLLEHNLPEGRAIPNVSTAVTSYYNYKLYKNP